MNKVDWLAEVAAGRTKTRAFEAREDTRAARDQALVNASLCTHRYKDDMGGHAKCTDCGASLLREAQRKNTGKTRRVKEAA